MKLEFRVLFYLVIQRNLETFRSDFKLVHIKNKNNQKLMIL